MRENGWALEYASDKMRGDRAVVLAAVERCPGARKFVWPGARRYLPEVVGPSNGSGGPGTRRTTSARQGASQIKDIRAAPAKGSLGRGGGICLGIPSDSRKIIAPGDHGATKSTSTGWDVGIFSGWWDEPTSTSETERAGTGRPEHWFWSDFFGTGGEPSKTPESELSTASAGESSSAEGSTRSSSSASCSATETVASQQVLPPRASSRRKTLQRASWLNRATRNPNGGRAFGRVLSDGGIKDPTDTLDIPFFAISRSGEDDREASASGASGASGERVPQLPRVRPQPLRTKAPAPDPAAALLLGVQDLGQQMTEWWEGVVGAEPYRKGT